MCAALANVEEATGSGIPLTPSRAGDYLVDQDAAEIMAKKLLNAVLDLEKMGLPFNRTPEGASTSVVLAGTPAITVKPPCVAHATLPTALVT